MEKILFYVDGCWLWQGAQDGKGYGSVWWNGKKGGAHKLVYELFIGEVPAGLELDHLCRKPLCVNPSHLEPVTHKENLRRGKGNPKKQLTHCMRGHAFSNPKNLGLTRQGKGRRCNACRRLKNKQRKDTQ